MCYLQPPQLVGIDLRRIPSYIMPLALQVSGQPGQGIEMSIPGEVGEKYFHLFFRQTSNGTGPPEGRVVRVVQKKG